MIETRSEIVSELKSIYSNATALHIAKLALVFNMKQM